MAKFKHRNNLIKIKHAREARSNNRFINEDAIKMAYQRVNEKFPVPFDDLRSSSRKRKIVNARNTLVWICYYVLDHSMEQIGDFFGRKHSTASVICGVVEDWYDTEKPYRDALDDLLFNQYNQPRLTQEAAR
jgi:chromosomal replication initiation ATPase DnaA